MEFIFGMLIGAFVGGALGLLLASIVATRDNRGG